MPNEDEIKKLEEEKKALEAKLKAKEDADAKAKAEAEAKAKAEAEAKAKAEEEAKKKAEQDAAEKAKAAQKAKPDGRSIDDYVLKEDLGKIFNPLAEKIDALILETQQLKEKNKTFAEQKAEDDAKKAELEAKKAELEAQIKALQDKYENTPFGNAQHGGVVTPTQKTSKYVSFDELSAPFMNK